MKGNITILGSLFVLFCIASSFMGSPFLNGAFKTTRFNKYQISDSIRIDTISGKIVKLFKDSVHASYYHDKFNGRRTASGQIFNNSQLTAAHKKLKFGTQVLVTNPINNKSVLVTINDRGPFVRGREIDLSKKAFMDISHSTRRGELQVKLEIVQEEEE